MPILDNNDFQNLKAVYEEQISTVTATIWDMYNSKPSEVSSTIRFSLPQDDRNALNTGSGVLLNIFERGMVSPNHENARIVNFKIYDIKVHLEGDQNPSFANFDLLLEHSGRSMMRNNGEIYWFDHINNQNQNPITWGMTYDAKYGITDQHEPSAASQSLLYSLLDKLGQTNNIMIYSRPGAWSDIRISKTDVTSGNTKMVIDELTFELQYDFVQRPTNNRNLDVYAADIENGNMILSPYIAISRTDKSGRADGRGTLYRTYNSNSSVNLEAPEEYGRYKFVNWVNRYDDIVSTQKQVSVTLSNDTWVKANYRYMGPGLSVQDSVNVGREEGTVAVKIKNTGSEEMEWSVVSNTPWLSITSADEGIDDEYLILHFEENPLEMQRTGSITITAPETEEYKKELYVIQSKDAVSIVNDNAKKEEEKPKIVGVQGTGIYSCSLPSSANRITVDVFNSVGQLVMKDYSYGTSSVDINLSYCSQGVYIIRLEYDGKVFVQKVIR
jgi:hypothetical protein